jgi:hypothetical protein
MGFIAPAINFIIVNFGDPTEPYPMARGMFFLLFILLSIVLPSHH